MDMKTVRLALYVMIGVLLLALTGYGLYDRLRPAPVATGLLSQPSTTIGGPFSLIDQTGKPVTDKDLAGKPAAMFFGYTFCPDVCPTTLAEAGEWLKALGGDAAKLNVVFVTIDPERDTVDKLAAYLSSFDPHIRGLTGTPENIAAVIKEYRVFARKVPQGGSNDYLMDHTAAVYLMDGQGRFVGTINYQEEIPKAVAKLKALVAGS